MTGPNDRMGIRINLRFDGMKRAIYHALTNEPGRSMASVGDELGCSRAYVSQVMAQSRVIAGLPAPSREIVKALPPIEAEAVAMAGITTVADLRERLRKSRIPAWWPVDVTVALCKRYGFATPLVALRKASLLENLRSENEPTAEQVERELYQ